MSWYNGTDLLNLIESLTITEDVSGDGVLQVQHVIRPKTEKFHDYRGFAGKVKSGVFQKGDQIEVFPSGQKTTVKSIEKYVEQTQPLLLWIENHCHVKSE
jgi:sulfate adenylyltransferase subunit 1